jgi:hypothetical protein
VPVSLLLPTEKAARARARPTLDKEKAVPREAARTVGLVEHAQDAPGAGALQGGARKEKAAHEGRPEFRTFC